MCPVFVPHIFVDAISCHSLPAAIVRLLSGRIESVVADISEDDFQKRPAPHLNPPVWLLGHLAVSIDAVSKFAGEPYHLSEDWHASFNAQSTPFENATPYPSKAEILSAYKEVLDRSVGLMDNMTADELAARPWRGGALRLARQKHRRHGDAAADRSHRLAPGSSGMGRQTAQCRHHGRLTLAAAMLSLFRPDARPARSEFR